MLELMPPFYFLTFAKVSVSVSKNLVSKKSRYRSRKDLVSKKSLGIGLENIWSRKKVSVLVSKIFCLKKSIGLGNFGLEKNSRYRSRWNFLVSSLSAGNTGHFVQFCCKWVFLGTIASDSSRSRILRVFFFIPFPFPKFGNVFFSFPPRSWI